MSVTGGSNWQRDSTPPILKILLPTPNGINGWFHSQIDVTAEASDAVSGLFSIAGSANGGGWTALPIHLEDGCYSIRVSARDKAGNEAMLNHVVRVDTVAPVSQFTSHANRDVIQGNVTLGGTFEDHGSGVSCGEISFDQGITWQLTSWDDKGIWSFTCDSA